MNDPNNKDVAQPIHTLIDRERIRGASRMIAEGTEATHVSAEQIAAVRGDVEIFCRNHKISRKQLATAVGVGHATVSEFLSNKYAGNNATLAIDLENWLVEEEQRRGRPATTQFVWTNVAMQIKSVANYCLDYRKIGLVYGPDTSGIGKTTAMRAIHQELGPRRSSLATIDKVDASASGLLKKLCSAMRLAQNKSNRSLFDRVVDHLKGRSHLLLIDQIHNLRFAKDDRPFYILADLYDATQTAQMWCGTADLVGYLNRQRTKSGDESLAQIRRRIFPCVNLMEMLNSGGKDGRGQPLADVDQVREMFAKNKLKLTAAAIRFLCSLLNRPDTGGIGFCEQLVEYATMLGSMRSVHSIDVPLIKEAMNHGITSERAGTLVHEVEEADAASRKVG
jgi:DNA transposition AAA+ family ATPase